MAGYVVRISLPDRPGALGLVASRIGAVGGDIVAIHILERVEDNAIDEFVIDLAGAHLVPLLRNEIHEVDGAEVLDVSPLPATSSPPATS
jgi:ACT domain-containing protein